nr:CGNR zinc finger domain-containing protein [Sulfobacillus harzensis]
MKEGSRVKPEFTALGGTLAIDFVNTVQWHGGTVHDVLMSPTDLNEWLQFMVDHEQLTSAQYRSVTIVPMTSDDLALLKSFRTVGRDYLSGGLAEGDFVEHLHRAAEDTPLILRLDRTHGGYARVAMPVDGGSRGLVTLLAADWMRLFAEGIVSRIKACANARCLAYFVDVSGRRKWCSMADCGNRIKNARYHQRRQGI